MCSGVWGCKYLFVLKDLSPHLMFYFSQPAHCVLFSFTTVFISLQLFKTWDLFSQWKKTRKLDLQVSYAHIDNKRSPDGKIFYTNLENEFS